MPPSYSPAPYPMLAVGALVLCAAILVLSIRARRNRASRVGLAFLLAMTIVLAIAAGGLTLAAYEEYRWTYTYTLDISANGTSPEAIVLPVPGDTSLLTGLQLVRGQATWSLLDTVHGRGLYLRFNRSAEIGVTLSEFAPGGPSHDTTLSMANSTTPYGPVSNWIYSSGDGATLEFQVSETWAATGLWIWGGLLGQTLPAGWHTHYLNVGFVP